MKMASVLKNREQNLFLPEGSRISDLLQVLENRYGQNFINVFYEENGKLKFQIILNGRNIFLLDGLKTELKDEDHIFFLPPTCGG